MNRFLAINGTPTNRMDPKKLIWYGPCGYWTDDWDSIITVGIPCCPICRCPGFQIESFKWFEGAIAYEKSGNPQYHQFLLDSREKCFKKLGGGLLTAYEQYKNKSP